MLTIFFLIISTWANTDCEKIKTEALKKIDQANYCKTNDDCVLFKSDLTCKGQGINKKVDPSLFKSLAKEYTECLAKQEPPALFACTTDFVSTANPCQNKKCLNNRDAYEKVAH